MIKHASTSYTVILIAVLVVYLLINLLVGIWASKKQQKIDSAEGKGFINNYFIGGRSMGGYGTTLHALKYPEKFTYAYAMSPAVSGDMTALVDAKADKSVFPGFTFEVGNQDTTVDNAGTKKLADYMADKGIKVEWIARDGIHYWNFWQECLPKALAKAGESFK